MNTEEIMNLANGIAHAWDWATETSQPRPNHLDVTVKQLKELLPIAVGLRVKRLGQLSAIVGLDLGLEANEIEVLYHFCPGEAEIVLRVRVPRQGGELPTLSEVFPIAEVFERELHEMYGIEIAGLRNTERLYLPENWPAGVYPMLKDFDPKVLSEPEGKA
ncbi:MAG TPA: NADH-quinone oxidoreductase subunit C [Anaerolineales bacterium]|nr:NADH-quinone oxidoreductase subunit C [Anaerolineales bacterium]